jgi:V8-like Glu-specific endopeptidase
MPSIVDAFPYPWTDPEAQALHLTLTSLYSQEKAALYVTDAVGIPSYKLALGQPALYLWRDILDLGAAMVVNRKLVELARDQNRNNPRGAFFDGVLTGARPGVETQPRKGDGSPLFISGDDTVGAPEALLFHDDLSEGVGLVPGLIETLKRMVALAPAVAMLEFDNGSVSGAGTAFRVGADLLLTNHHVLFPYGARATRVVAQFGFDTDAGGLALASTSIVCDPDSIVADEADDWGVIRAQAPLDPAWPIVSLAEAGEPRVGDRAFILQHPLRARKRLGFVRNTVVDFDDRVVHYLTDTQQGSSGAPVFDRDGRIIALHHVGGAPQEGFGKPPLTKNEGIRISRVYKALTGQGLL